MFPHASLQTLLCRRTEDNTGADECQLSYNGQRVFTGSLNNGQSANLGVVKFLNQQARVDLFDADFPDADDDLGRIIINVNELGLGQRSQEFRGDGARYTLFYSVTNLDIVIP